MLTLLFKLLFLMLMLLIILFWMLFDIVVDQVSDRVIEKRLPGRRLPLKMSLTPWKTYSLSNSQILELRKVSGFTNMLMELKKK